MTVASTAQRYAHILFRDWFDGAQREQRASACQANSPVNRARHSKKGGHTEQVREIGPVHARIKQGWVTGRTHCEYSIFFVRVKLLWCLLGKNE
ncbi:hypothetical protein AB3S75_028372 [Citrus x aurantiifolia]